jgi:mercuric reductase
MVDYDLAIIGSGGAAFGAAIEARRLGAQVVIVERSTVGGTCVNVGCVPSKILLAGAKAYHTASASPFAGLPTHIGPVDLAAIVAQKNDLVADMRQHKYLDLADNYGLRDRPRRSPLQGRRHLTFDGPELQAHAHVVASGSEPMIPALPGLADACYLTSTTAMEQTTVPERLVTIGGGFVGLELSQLFARLGARVTIIGRVAPRAETELASRLCRVLSDEGINVVNARATAVERRGDTTVVETDGGTEVDGDTILVATGRRARLEALDPAAADIELDSNSFIKTDTTLRTTNPRVFAAGDVVGGPQFVYVAAAQGKLAAKNAVGRRHDTIDYTGLPGVFFTDPQLGQAGLTEAGAVAAGYSCDCRVLEFDNVPRALVDHDTRGAIKLVADRHTGKVLGVHAIATGAGDLLLAGVYAIKFGLTVNDLASTWAPYLTASEALRLVAKSFTREIDQLSCCAA